MCCRGQALQEGDFGVHTVAPSSISACAITVTALAPHPQHKSQSRAQTLTQSHLVEVARAGARRPSARLKPKVAVRGAGGCVV